ncbi:hypothetical protein NFI96_013045, partial [Prochilodus magdalenae]
MHLRDPVISSLGRNATIPCSFTIDVPIGNSSKTVIWWRKEPYKGPLVYICVRNTGLSGNCTESTGRYSFGGDLTEQNIALRISNVTHTDVGKYFCRIQLDMDAYTSEKIELEVKEPQELRRIYIETTVKGERLVTCDVSGQPPPAVTWTQPENITTSQISNLTDSLVSYSVPASHNTEYTCQIDGEDGHKVAQSIFHRACIQCSCQNHIYLALIGCLGTILAIVLIVSSYVMATLNRK